MSSAAHPIHTLSFTLKRNPPHSPKPVSKPSSLIIAGSKISGRKLRAAVIGGGPAGSSAAEALASGGIETFLFERSPEGAKPCGGAIPLCMLDEFSIPLELVDRKVTHMKIISPSNLTVDFGKTLKPHEFISMLRREVLDSYLRSRAETKGATLLKALVTNLEVPTSAGAPYVVNYTTNNSRQSLAVDVVIGADGANSRVAKSIDAGNYACAIAFQERIRLPDHKMEYYQNLAEMYIGNDVSPDFYAWVFPKCDHVAVGTGTVCSKQNIKMFQHGIRARVNPKIEGGQVIKVEAHPIPEHPRPIRVRGRVALVGDAAGYVTKCSGEGIYFAAKSGRMCGEGIVKASEGGERMISEEDLKREYLKEWDAKYINTFRFLDLLQKVFYGSNAAREALVELCGDEYVQRMTFESYLYKKLANGKRWEDVKLVSNTIGSLIRCKLVGREMEGLRRADLGAAVMSRVEDGAAKQDDLLYDHLGEKDDLWFDFMADTGDGENSSYSVACLPAQSSIRVRCSDSVLNLPHGNLLIIGGDLATFKRLYLATCKHVRILNDVVLDIHERMAVDLPSGVVFRKFERRMNCYHTLYEWYRSVESEHFPDPTGLRDRIEQWTFGLYPACIKYLMSAFDVLEVMAVTRNNMCKNGKDSFSRGCAVIYCASVFLYFWVFSTPVVSLIFGSYLYICINWIHLHFDEAFSSLRIADYKAFMRFHINRNGNLEVFSLAVDKVPKEWKLDPDWDGEPKQPQQPNHLKSILANGGQLQTQQDPVSTVWVVDHLVIQQTVKSNTQSSNGEVSYSSGISSP